MIFVVFLILNDNCNPGIKTSWLKNKMYLLLVLVQDAIIKYYRLGALSNKHFFLTVLKAEKSKIKSPTDLVSGEHSLSGLQTAVSSPGGKERDRVGRGGERENLLILKEENPRGLHPPNMLLPEDPTSEHQRVGD